MDVNTRFSEKPVTGCWKSVLNRLPVLYSTHAVCAYNWI